MEEMKSSIEIERERGRSRILDEEIAAVTQAQTRD